MLADDDDDMLVDAAPKPKFCTLVLAHKISKPKGATTSLPQ